jgi:hypothetical protein
VRHALVDRLAGVHAPVLVAWGEAVARSRELGLLAPSVPRR